MANTSNEQAVEREAKRVRQTRNSCYSTPWPMDEADRAVARMILADREAREGLLLPAIRAHAENHYCAECKAALAAHAALDAPPEPTLVEAVEELLNGWPATNPLIENVRAALAREKARS